MSKHAIDRSAWSPAEHDEYEQMLAEICEATTDSSERLDLFEVKLHDAVQAHRPWARDVERACQRHGMGSEVIRFQGRQKAMVSHDGRLISAPAIQARRSVGISGEAGFQRELIELWAWDAIEEKRADALRVRRTYTDRIAHYDRLLALRVMAPEAATPADAAAQLGIDLAAWLGEEEAV